MGPRVGEIKQTVTPTFFPDPWPTGGWAIESIRRAADDKRLYWSQRRGRWLKKPETYPDMIAVQMLCKINDLTIV